MLSFSGILAGYKGDFSFDSGAKYPPNLNYGLMRTFCAFFGALTIPFAYFTGLELGFSGKASFFMAFLVLTGQDSNTHQII